MFDPDMPHDIVAPRPWTTALLDQINDQFTNAGAEVTMSTPGQLLEDVDGLPLGVTAPTLETGTLGAPTMHGRILEALGITPDEACERWPNLRWAGTTNTTDTED